MKTFDDILYPYYLEYGYCRDNFYQNNIDKIKQLFKQISNGGKFWFKYVTAKNGDKCYSVGVIYKNELILNRVGYNDKNIALMSMVDAIRNNKFDRFVK